MLNDLKSYPLYKESNVAWLGEIPSHWITLRGKVLFKESLLRVRDFDEIVTCFRDGQVTLRRNRRKSGFMVALKEAGYQGVRKGQLVIHAMDAFAGAVGVSETDGKCTPEYIVCDPRRADVVPGYFASALRVAARSKFIEVECPAVRERAPRLRYPNFGNLRLPVPSLMEQASIVRYLAYADRRLQRYIRATKKLIALLNEQKQVLIHRAVTRGLDPSVRLKPSGVDWLKDIPEHWEIWQIGHFGRVGNGSTPSRGNAGYWNGGTYPWLNSSSVNRGRITKADQFVTKNALQECHLPLVQPGSILMAITGQGKTRGTAAILDIEATINQHLAFITPYRTVIDPEYLLLTLTGAYRELRAISDDSGSTKGALTCGDIAHFKVALPPLSEQALIVSEVRQMTQYLEEALARTEWQVDLIQEYRTRLISDVVTGKLDVREAAAQLPEEAEEAEWLDEDESSEGDEAEDVVDQDATEESEA